MERPRDQIRLTNTYLPMSDMNHRSELFAKLQQHTKRVDEVADACTDEPKTEQYLVEPFLEVLGYDSRDPRDVVKRFTADVAGRKGEKVDYALMRDDDPVVLVEAKGKDNRLGRGEIEQLQRYFPHTPARLAVLTDGILWRWYKGRLEPERSHEMDSSPFLTYDVREPSQTAAEWLTRVTKGGFDRDELLRISRRIEFTAKIRNWVDRALVNPTETVAAQLNGVAGLDASDDELPIIVEAAGSAWIQVIGEPVRIPMSSDSTDDESRTDENAEPDESNPTEMSTAGDIANQLQFVSRLDDNLDIGGGKTLSRNRKRRAWRIQGHDWRIEDSMTRLTSAVLGEMLGCDSRRDDEHALADHFGLRIFDEPPHWRWEPVPGFENLYYNKNTTAAEKRDFLKRVAGDLVFEPPDEHPLRKDGKIEWWLPKLNA